MAVTTRSDRFKLFGSDTQLTDVARIIMTDDVDGLKQIIAKGLDINRPAQITDLTEELPITVALIEEKTKILDFLLATGVNLNDAESPAFVTAVKNNDAETIRRLVSLGARVDLEDSVGKNAYSSALYSGRFDLLSLILELGLPIDADGGKSFRQAVYNRQMDAVRFFVEHGMDVNARTPDMVFPYNPTAVCVAASNNDFEMVRYLVEHGANVTLKDVYGDRPYSYAVANKNVAMQDFLRPLEPPQWHAEEDRVRELKLYKLPPALADFLRQPERRITLTDCEIRYIEFHHLLDAKPFRWEGRRVIDLLREVDNYEEVGFLAWSSKDKKLVHIDIEHDEIRVLCSWNEFIKSPGRWINKIFE